MPARVCNYGKNLLRSRLQNMEGGKKSLFNGSHALTSCSMQSSINPLNMRDPIRICSGLAWKHLPEVGWMIVAHRLASRLDTFGENLTQSPRTELDLGWFHTVWSWTSVEEHNRVWKWETGSGPVASYQKPDLLVPAHWLAFRPDAFGQDPDQVIQIRCRSVLHNMDHAFFGETELNWM